MDHNPYAPPQQFAAPPEHWPDVCVDGRCIVVGSKAVLPDRCVITNEPASEDDRRTRTFDWAPSFRLVLRRRRCRLSYCINRKHRLFQYRVRTLIALIAFCLLWFFAGMHAVWIFPLVLLFAGGFPSDPLTVKQAKDGRFWITGFGDAFLASCRDEYGRC